MQLYLGLDMATHNSGVALLDQDGNLVDHRNIYGGDGDVYTRCKYIYDQLDSYLSEHTDIKYIGLEDILLNKWVPNLNACRDLAILRGWILAVLHKDGLSADTWTANEWKGRVGIFSGPEGRNKAVQKLRAIKLVKDKFGIDVDDNQADAICIALAEIDYINSLSK